MLAVAGVIDGHPAWNVPDGAFDLMLRVNLYGVRHLADACVPPMVAAVPRGALPELPSRHLGLVTADSRNLPPETLEALSALLPPHWSQGNPVDLLDDATPGPNGVGVHVVD